VPPTHFTRWQTKSEYVIVPLWKHHAAISICASIFAARKLATVPRNSPAYVAAIADAVADARRIVEKVDGERRQK